MSATKTCWYCDRALTFAKRLRGANFCSNEHEDLYLAKQASLALDRVLGFAAENAAAPEAAEAQNRVAESSQPGASTKPAPETQRALEAPAGPPPALPTASADDIAPKPPTLPYPESFRALEESSADAFATRLELNPLERRPIPEIPAAPAPPFDAAPNFEEQIYQPERSAPVSRSPLSYAPKGEAPKSNGAPYDGRADIDEPPVLDRILPQLRMLPMKPAAPSLVAYESLDQTPEQVYPQMAASGGEWTLPSCGYQALRARPPAGIRLARPEPVALNPESPTLPDFPVAPLAALEEFPATLTGAPLPVGVADEARLVPDSAMDFRVQGPAAPRRDGLETAGRNAPGIRTGHLETEVLKRILAPNPVAATSGMPVVPASEVNFPLRQPTVPQRLLAALEITGHGTLVLNGGPTAATADRIFAPLTMASSETPASNPNALDFPAPQAVWPRPLRNALEAIARDINGLPSGILENSASGDAAAKTAAAAEESAAYRSEELPRAGALATWTSELRDVTARQVIVSAQFDPWLHLGRPLAACVPVLQDALPSIEDAPLQARKPTAETAPPSCLQGAEFAHSDLLKPRAAEWGMPLDWSAGGSPEARAVFPGTRPGTFAAPPPFTQSQPFWAVASFSREISRPRATSVLTASVTPACALKSTTRIPDITVERPRGGVLEPCAASSALALLPKYCFPQGRAIPAQSHSLPRSTVLSDYNPAVLKSGGTPAFTNSRWIRSSPASLFGLPQASRRIDVTFRGPGTALQSTVSPVIAGPAPTFHLVTIPPPPRALMFHWVGSVDSAALIWPPIAEVAREASAGFRTKPAPTPAQPIETIHLVVEIPLEAQPEGCVQPVTALQPMVTKEHPGAAPPPTKPHLSRTRVRPASIVELPAIPAHVLGWDSTNRLGRIREAHEPGVSDPHGTAGFSNIRQGAGNISVEPNGPSIRNLGLRDERRGGVSKSEFEPVSADRHLDDNMLILKDIKVSFGVAAPASIPAQRGLELPSGLPDLSGAIRRAIAMKKLRS